MSTYVSDSVIEWRVLAAEPATRIAAAHDYALTVFATADDAARWLDRVSPAVQEGRCTIAAACKTPDGFVEAICELVRIASRDGQPGQPAAPGA